MYFFCGVQVGYFHSIIIHGVINQIHHATVEFCADMKHELKAWAAAQIRTMDAAQHNHEKSPYIKKPNLTYQHISVYLCMYIQCLDPPMNLGHQTAYILRDISCKKGTNKKEKAVLVRKWNSIPKQVKVDTHEEDESLPIIPGFQTVVARASFLAELSNIICTYAISLYLPKSIFVPIENEADDLIKTGGSSQDVLTTKQVDPSNKVMRKCASQYTKNPNNEDRKRQVICDNAFFENFIYNLTRVNISLQMRRNYGTH